MKWRTISLELDGDVVFGSSYYSNVTVRLQVEYSNCELELSDFEITGHERGPYAPERWKVATNQFFESEENQEYIWDQIRTKEQEQEGQNLP